MTFVHQDPDFPDLLRIVAEAQQIAAALVEKDYWVTHCLWALQEVGLEIWFKGGTSLSKGFGLIQRFSEDLDLKLEGGTRALPAVGNWKSKERGPMAERRAFFEAIAALPLVDLELRLDEASLGERCTSAGIEARYAGHHLVQLPGALRPFVLLEIGDARVRPFVARPIRSWVHDHLVTHGMAGEFTQNQPKSLRCIHPTVTLLEKLDGISRRFHAGTHPSQFVRHIEDAARIIQAEKVLPPLEASVRELAQEMHAQHQIRHLPKHDDAAFQPLATPAWGPVRLANEAISPMFWGQRIPLEEAAQIIRAWVAKTF